METILLYNQCVPLGKLAERDFTLEDGRCVVTLARASNELKIPLNGNLLEFFETSGTNVPPTVTAADCWRGPIIDIGFESFNVVSSSHNGYLRIWGLDRGFDRVNQADDPFQNHNVSLRIDIDTLTDDASRCSLKPDVMSHVFEMRWKNGYYFSDFDDFTRSVSVTFRTARTSTANNEDRRNVDKLRQNWELPDGNWKLTMSLSLILAPKSETGRPDPSVSDCLIPNKRMRMNPDETFADFTIITGNGTRVKCHRAMLVTQSPYFDRMLKSDMKEARTGTVELGGMTVEGVGAMLDFLYTSNLAVLEGNPLVCVEVLEAGHQYDIEPLEEWTKKILLSKPNEWYTPEAALRLMLYMKDMDMYDLKEKSVQVFKKWFLAIQTLPAYDKLWEENPKVVKQLLEYAFNALN